MSRMDPYRFEQLVVDLLFAMGYGGSRAEAVKVTQKSNDSGIDGIISEDRLGLDVICVQAKRWQSTVRREPIQSFVGALAGKHATKGVFITTNDFHKNALECARGVTHRIILINASRPRPHHPIPLHSPLREHPTPCSGRACGIAVRRHSHDEHHDTLRRSARPQDQS